MKKYIHLLLFSVVTVFASFPASAQNQQQGLVFEQLRVSLEPVYNKWRNAMIRKDYASWKSVTASSRQMHAYNRVISAKHQFPASVFKIPVAPPSLAGLKAVNVNMKGATATATYYGKVDFGVGGDPTENLLVLHFVGEGKAWKYNGADFINLLALPDVRKQLQAGDYTYVKNKDFLSDGVVAPVPYPVRNVDYIAQVYAFCPGRAVEMKVNKDSKHKFQNEKRAEVIIGGAKHGRNDLELKITDLPGSKGGDVITVRVYLMSQVKGVKPIKVYEYQVTTGKDPIRTQNSNFTVTSEMAKKLKGQ